MRGFYILLTFLCLGVFGYAQTDFDYDDENPFAIKKYSFTTLDSSQIKSVIPNINISRINIICYIDSKSADTVRLAYSIKNKNKWISLVTPFNQSHIPWDCKLIDIDSSGQPEIVVKGIVASEMWPYGEKINEAIIIYKIDKVPTQIFKLFYRCNEFNVGDRTHEGEGGYAVTLERNIEVKKGSLIIKKLTIGKLDENEDRMFKDWCHFSKIEFGTYKLIKGKFVKQ